MTTIDITEGGFTINGTSSTVVAESLSVAGLSNTTIAEIVGGWFVGVTGSTTPTPFRFDTDVEANDPSCVVDYSRGFAHVDWIDGESRVQAGMTPEELGVNARFHSLENEFDAIGDQFARLGNCVAALRSDLFGVAAELEAKITTLQNQVHTLEQEGREEETGPVILGTATFDGRDSFVTKFGNDFKFVDFASTPIKTTRPTFGGLEVFDPGVIDPGELGGLVLDIDEAFTHPAIDALFGDGPVTVTDVRRHGADVTLPSGVALGTVIAALPGDATFATRADAVAGAIESIVAELPDGRIAAVRSEVLAGDSVDRTGGALLNSGVTGVTTDPRVAEALGAAGFGTIGRLASADRTDVLSAVGGLGVAVDAGSIDAAIAGAMIGSAIRNRT
ncbi:hypothetical protein [Ilumatobacter sp.]|uniref:hypothetical protein n=1 Tax=Ilumatobacter sp. TaxID=1967498 RepID=UPI003B52FE11